MAQQSVTMSEAVRLVGGQKVQQLTGAVERGHSNAAGHMIGPGIRLQVTQEDGAFKFKLQGKRQQLVRARNALTPPRRR